MLSFGRYSDDNRGSTGKRRDDIFADLNFPIFKRFGFGTERQARERLWLQETTHGVQSDDLVTKRHSPERKRDRISRF